ncbi:MAG TPA: FAD-binding oxidoreductase [Spirochaetota bacterium]|nr:FAD-binding oxidoreductase [Spirochaetota bacterium]
MNEWNLLAEKLRPIVGDDAILVGRDTEPYAADRWARGGVPPLVVLPATQDDVSRAVKNLYDAGLPFVARGRGTGMTGGALPMGRAAVISFERMNRIIEVRPDAFEMTVEPGALLSEVQAAAKSVGLLYPPDPASADECSIGGNIAENAGGLSCVKYGVTGEYVLSLDVVLPDGRIATFGSHARKDVAGLDLKRIVIGSEGMLALVTRIVLRLVPRPEADATVCCWFSGAEEAVSSLQAVMQGGVMPARAELIARECLRIMADDGVSVHPGAGALLLLGLDGTLDGVEEERKMAGRILEKRVLAMDSASGGDASHLWKLRSSLSPALKKLAPMKINEDIAVPLDRQADCIRFTEELAARTGLLIAVFGHAGDGNLHVNFMITPEEREIAEGAVGELFTEVVRLGGTITGEHGIGVAKAPWAGLRLDPVTLELCRSLKLVFDPKNLLNPGKALYGAVPGEITRLV